MTPARFIRTQLPLTPLPDLPGVSLHLAAPTSGLSRLTTATPYWAYVWAGGMALARYIRDHPDCVAGRRVLDLGAGSGLVGIVAAQAGARVQSAERDPRGCTAIRLNARANGVRLSVLRRDVLAKVPPHIDLILAGDVFYDAALVAPMLDILTGAQARGVDCLIGDPGRRDLPLHRLSPVAHYQVRDFGQSRPVTGTVFTLRSPL